MDSPTDVISSSAQGILRVMLVLLAVGKENAATVLRELTDEEIRAISQSANDLNGINPKALRQTAQTFEQAFAQSIDFIGTPEELHAVLGSASPPDTPLLAPSNEPIWSQISQVGTDKFLAFLEAQHPQTIAYILSRVDRVFASTVLGALLSPQRNDILSRMLVLRAVDPTVEKLVVQSIQIDLFDSNSKTIGHHATIADLLSRLDQQQTRDVMGHLIDHKPDDAKIVKRLLFNFDDLSSLPRSALALVVERVPAEKMVMALQGTSIEFRAPILAALAPRARRMVEGELQAGTNVNLRDVADARRATAAMVLAFIKDGTITLSADDSPNPAST